MDIVCNLEDAGCGARQIADICRSYDEGRIQDAVRALRRHRCVLMDELHESQDRVDCLDYLICRLEKERKEKKCESAESWTERMVF